MESGDPDWFPVCHSKYFIAILTIILQESSLAGGTPLSRRDPCLGLVPSVIVVVTVEGLRSADSQLVILIVKKDHAQFAVSRRVTGLACVLCLFSKLR